jgi:hypothetical protein
MAHSDINAEDDGQGLLVPVAFDEEDRKIPPDTASPDRDYRCPRCGLTVFLRIIPDRRLHFVHRSDVAGTSCAALRRTEQDLAKAQNRVTSEEEQRARDELSASRAEQARHDAAIAAAARAKEEADAAQRRAAWEESETAFAGIAPTLEDRVFAAEAQEQARQADAERRRITAELEERRLRDLRARPPPAMRPADMPQEVPLADYDARCDEVWLEILRRRRSFGESFYASPSLPYLIDNLRETIAAVDGPVRPGPAYAANAMAIGDIGRFRAVVEWALTRTP